jgi:hypothetical protein
MPLTSVGRFARGVGNASHIVVPIAGTTANGASVAVRRLVGGSEAMRGNDVVNTRMEIIGGGRSTPRRVVLGALIASALAAVLVYSLPGAGDAAAAANECTDMIDNDGDGLVDRYRPSPVPGQDPTLEGADPGCLVGPPSVENPAPVATTVRLVTKIYRSRERDRCALNVRVVLRSAQHVMARGVVGPGAKVDTELTLTGISGAARGYRSTRNVGGVRTSPFAGFFQHLKHGRYHASAFYPGDAVRQRSGVATRTVNIGSGDLCTPSHSSDSRRGPRGSS